MPIVRNPQNTPAVTRAVHNYGTVRTSIARFQLTTLLRDITLEGGKATYYAVHSPVQLKPQLGRALSNITSSLYGYVGKSEEDVGQNENASDEKGHEIYTGDSPFSHITTSEDKSYSR